MQDPVVAVEPPVKPVEPVKPVIVDPEDAVLELRRENEKLRKKYEAKLKEEEDLKKKALEEQGKYKELYEAEIKANEPLKAKLTKLEEQEKVRHEALLLKLPEDAREKYKGVSIDILEDMVTRFLDTKDPNKPVKSGHPGEITLEKQLEEAQKRYDTVEIVRLKREIAEKARAA